MLKTNSGRIHDYLRLSLVDKCNLRCTYCMPENVEFMSRKALMSEGEIMNLAKIFVEDFGIKKIRITGGEPLVRKGAHEIIRGLSQFPVELAITTNAILLDRYLDLFEEIGLRSINISLDTFDRARFKKLTLRDEFDQVMNNISLALKRNFKVRLNMVVVRGENAEEIPTFVARSMEEHLHVRFIEFMPFDGNRWQWDKVYSYLEILHDIQAQFKIEKLVDKPHSTSKSYRVKGGKGTFAVISSVTMPFCGTCNRLRLTADGKLRNCLFATTEWDLLTPLRSGQGIHPLIEEAVSKKHAKLGGLPDFQDQEKLIENLSDRSMVNIGASRLFSNLFHGNVLLLPGISGRYLLWCGWPEAA